MTFLRRFLAILMAAFVVLPCLVLCFAAVFLLPDRMAYEAVNALTVPMVWFDKLWEPKAP